MAAERCTFWLDAAPRGHDVLERADVVPRADAAEGLGGVGAGEVLCGVRCRDGP